jgi:hypothetical protein
MRCTAPFSTHSGQKHILNKNGHKNVETTTMINAFLVFNGQGQPRLTKFYTQLVRQLLDPTIHLSVR